MPDEVLLRWGEVGTLTLERSSDGGETWQSLGTSTTRYYLRDTDVSPGHTYYYRTFGSHSYLGNTMTAPGQPVTTPEWNAPRVLPHLQSVTWGCRDEATGANPCCPAGASRYLCRGTLHMTLTPEDGGEWPEDTTIRVFLNEPTFQLTDGQGLDIPMFNVQDLSLLDMEGYDAPACVERAQEADREVEAQQGAGQVAVDLSGVVFGGNGLRFEVQTVSGEVSERAVIAAVFNAPINDTYDNEYPAFLPVLIGDVIASSSPQIRGLGPVSRNSPDCRDGDAWYDFGRAPSTSSYNDALFFDSVSFGSSRQNVSTDADGLWTHDCGWVDDGPQPLRMRPPRDAFVRCHLGRVILRPDGYLVTPDFAPNISTEQTGRRRSSPSTRPRAT